MSYGDFDYAPVGYYDDEDELLKRGGYAPAVPPPPDPTPAAASAPSSPYPAVGSTEDLEARSAARMSPYPPAAPAVGSTEDLEARAANGPGSLGTAMQTPAPPRPQWNDYAPPEPHGWSKFGHALAAINPITNRIFNEMPEKRAEEQYKNATAEYEAPINEAAKQAETEQKQGAAEKDRADAQAKLHPQAKEGVTPEETTIHDLMTGENGGPRMNPATGKPYTYLDAYTAVAQAKQDTKPDPAVKDKEKDIADYLAAHNLEDTPANREKARAAIANRGKQEPGSFMPLYDEKGHVTGAWDPKSGRVVKTPEGGLPGTTSQGMNATRAEVTAHDKAYVQPAEAVEKSYQMADGAYREYEAARAAGKELPTGAQSMVALSTHLSTTFGNVKGARITKDMIQEHLGARSVSDSALVAIQKLTNGDTLSPDQWNAFHDLIGQSRKLSWQIAAKEADRKHIPIDFLPRDLQSMSHEPGDAGTQAHTFTFNGQRYENVPDELYKKYQGKPGFSE